MTSSTPTPSNRRSRRTFAALTAVAASVGLITVACGDDDDEPDDTSVDVITSDVTATSVVTVDSEVTVGTVVTSEVEVTETTTVISQVEITEPGVTSED